MLFNSVPFLAFFPTFVLIYYLTHGRVRLWVSLVASYVFYGWWDVRFLLLVGATTILDYSIGLLIARTEVQELRKRLLVTSIVPVTTAGVNTTMAGTGSSPGGPLPFTGSGNAAEFFLLGIVATLIGSGMVAVARHRRAHADR